jgi:uncharacterized membrane protein
MKKELPIGVILVAILLAIAIAGYFVYQSVKTPDVSTPDPQEMKRRMMQKQEGGATPAPAPAPGAPKPTR